MTSWLDLSPVLSLWTCPVINDCNWPWLRPPDIILSLIQLIFPAWPWTCLKHVWRVGLFKLLTTGATCEHALLPHSGAVLAGWDPGSYRAASPCCALAIKPLSLCLGSSWMVTMICNLSHPSYALLRKPQGQAELYHTAVALFFMGLSSCQGFKTVGPTPQSCQFPILTYILSCISCLVIICWLVASASLPALLLYPLSWYLMQPHRLSFIYHILQLNISFANLYRNLR